MSMLAQVSRSSSVNKSSRWSTSPDSTAVSQVPQKPISHEDGCSTPASRTGYPFRAARRNLADHRQDGGDADAARHEHVALRLGEREVRPRQPDVHDASGTQLAVRLHGAAAALRQLQDGDAVPRTVGGVAAQRVLPDGARRQVHVDVRAGLPWWEVGTVGGGELE